MTGYHGVRVYSFTNGQVSLRLDGGDDGIAVVAECGVSFVAGDSDGIGLVSGSRGIDRDHDGPLKATACTQATDGTGDGTAGVATSSRSGAESHPRWQRVGEDSRP